MDHRNFCCDGCQTRDFNGRRFHCLRCVNYDLCKECYDQNVESQEHRIEHPMQVMLHPENHQHPPDLMLNGEMLDLMHFPNCYTCPYCGIFGHTAKELIDHVVTLHRQNDSHVVCPMCADLPGIELVAIRNLARHLLLNHIEHANLLDPNTPPLRQALARASRRRRRQQAQVHGSQNGTSSRNTVRSNTSANHSPINSESGVNILYQLSELRRLRPGLRLSQTDANYLEGETRSRTVTLAIANSDTPICHETGNSAPTTGMSEHLDTDRYLLPHWMSEQQLETALRDEHGQQQRALFAEHILLSMLCEEQLELPEECEQQLSSQEHTEHIEIPHDDLNNDDAISLQSTCKYVPSQIMMLMSLPWIRPWSSQSNLRYIELQGVTIDESSLIGATEHQDID
ncbi:E3 ubiquitin-protein ligase KCMF1-like [Drosophila sulfurigaster albostrigata]|uniref:E3 ubiquitin-protein ligase KCMF1-like n=1 Tax=Drosophila sulfurigaster albostrigata TaxID=89887 RepID=UPI002D21E7D3|nr:E3 ubiquitin-protein ligase KCMF1-like [Drosophila sulfurigaster albostrigata]